MSERRRFIVLLFLAILSVAVLLMLRHNVGHNFIVQLG